jgi:hypothetical protein
LTYLCKIKLVLRGVRPPARYCIKKTFSHKSTKSPNTFPTHTQRHRSTREIMLALDPCFGMGQTRRFLQQQTTGRAIRLSLAGAGSTSTSAFCRTKRSCSFSSRCCICIPVLRFQHSARSFLGNLSPHRSIVAQPPASLCLLLLPASAPASLRLLRQRRPATAGPAPPHLPSTTRQIRPPPLCLSPTELEVGSPRCRREVELNGRG